jgi:hypothetical protein
MYVISLSLNEIALVKSAANKEFGLKHQITQRLKRILGRWLDLRMKRYRAWGGMIPIEAKHKPLFRKASEIERNIVFTNDEFEKLQQAVKAYCETSVDGVFVPDIEEELSIWQKFVSREA